MSGEADVEVAVTRAQQAFAGWSGMTAKSRAAIMFRFHALLEKHADELVRDWRRAERQRAVDRSSQRGANAEREGEGVRDGKDRICCY